MFTCSKCNSEVEELIKGRKDCRLCYNSYMAEYMLKRYHRRRTEWVIKLGSRCVDCGSVVDLEFDHDDKTTKSFDVAKALSGWAEKRLVAEMAKCVLRCSTCHAEKSAAEESVEHGGGVSGKKNCLCAACRPIKNAYMRSWKASNKYLRR